MVSSFAVSLDQRSKIRPNEMSLILALVRSYLTRIDSREEVARTNKNLDYMKVRFEIFKSFIRVDLQLQLEVEVDLPRQIRVFKGVLMKTKANF